jgi:hypothetical protein
MIATFISEWGETDKGKFIPPHLPPSEREGKKF